MAEAITMIAGGIKCDGEGCDFSDTTVEYEDYDQWLNKPCPKCGSNLLTQQDYDNSTFLREMVKLINETLPGPEPDEELFKMSASSDGTGVMVFSEITPLET